VHEPFLRKLKDKIKTVFNESNLRLKAYETGMSKRLSKFTPIMFLDSLLYDACSDITKSLNSISNYINKKYKVKISKQGIDNRYNAEAIKYVQSLIGEALSNQVKPSIEAGWSKLFNRILIKDSTKFDVSENLAKKLPGFGGSASKAGVCIQYEFDLKSGDVNDLAITAANRPDSKDSSETIDKVKKGDLALRDLGYSKLKCFFDMDEKGAYFISKLSPSIAVYEKKKELFVELDFVKLNKLMTQCKIQRLDKQVFIGEKDKLPVRLIIELMPEAEVIKRIKKVEKENKKRGNKTSEKYKNRAHFNLFITNIKEDIIGPGEISKIYKLRWQVELVFKVWKSIFGIDNNHEMKYERLICLLNARLLLILINWGIFMQKRSEIFEKKGKLLSMNKCFKTLKDNIDELRQILMNNCKKIINWVKEIFRLFDTNHWLEKKKNKIGFDEILLLKCTYSNNYEYIWKRKSEAHA
jgi:hypothetical protein